MSILIKYLVYANNISMENAPKEYTPEYQQGLVSLYREVRPFEETGAKWLSVDDINTWILKLIEIREYKKNGKGF